MSVVHHGIPESAVFSPAGIWPPQAPRTSAANVSRPEGCAHNRWLARPRGNEQKVRISSSPGPRGRPSYNRAERDRADTGLMTGGTWGPAWEVQNWRSGRARISGSQRVEPEHVDPEERGSFSRSLLPEVRTRLPGWWSRRTTTDGRLRPGEPRSGNWMWNWRSRRSDRDEQPVTQHLPRSFEEKGGHRRPDGGPSNLTPMFFRASTDHCSRIRANFAGARSTSRP